MNYTKSVNQCTQKKNMSWNLQFGTETEETKEAEETEWTGGITEEDGELVIEVPDGEDTAGE